MRLKLSTHGRASYILKIPTAVEILVKYGASRILTAVARAISYIQPVREPGRPSKVY